MRGCFAESSSSSSRIRTVRAPSGCAISGSMSIRARGTRRWIAGSTSAWEPARKNATFDGFGGEREPTDPKFSDDNWSLDLTHDLSADKNLFKAKNQNLRMSASFHLTKNYSISYSNYYNLKEGELISQSFRLIRDLHCWKLDLSFTKRNEYWDYRLTFFNTKFPDALRLQTRDSKRY